MLGVGTPTGAVGARIGLGAVAVALFGLLSMHGWGSADGSHSMAGTGSMSVTTSVTMHASDFMVAAVGPGTGEPEGGAGLLGPCLAVLVVLMGPAFGLAALLARAGFCVPRTLLPFRGPPVVVRRHRGPPVSGMLCVIRC